MLMQTRLRMSVFLGEEDSESTVSLNPMSPEISNRTASSIKTVYTTYRCLMKSCFILGTTKNHSTVTVNKSMIQPKSLRVDPLSKANCLLNELFLIKKKRITKKKKKKRKQQPQNNKNKNKKKQQKKQKTNKQTNTSLIKG